MVSDIQSATFYGILDSDILSDILSGICSDILSAILSGILSGMRSGPGPLHSLLSSRYGGRPCGGRVGQQEDASDGSEPRKEGGGKRSCTFVII